MKPKVTIDVTNPEPEPPKPRKQDLELIASKVAEAEKAATDAKEGHKQVENRIQEQEEHVVKTMEQFE